MERLFSEYSGIYEKHLRIGLLRTDTYQDYGLYHGKLGMAILFYEYSRKHKDKLYEIYADELINSIETIPSNLSFDIHKGLSGIAWGILYLFKRNFLTGDLNHILSDLDYKIIKQEKFSKEECKSILSYIKYKEEYMSSVNKNDKNFILSLKKNHLLSIYQGELYDEIKILRIIWSNWL